MNDKLIPQDILIKIKQLFVNAHDQKAALKIIRELFGGDWGVGHAQLARSLLVLSEGNLIELEKTLSAMEPRDIIMCAEAKAGNPSHYFILTFEEIEGDQTD